VRRRQSRALSRVLPLALRGTCVVIPCPLTGCVAQLVEQWTLNPFVECSIHSAPTISTLARSPTKPKAPACPLLPSLGPAYLVRIRRWRRQRRALCVAIGPRHFGAVRAIHVRTDRKAAQGSQLGGQPSLPCPGERRDGGVDSLWPDPTPTSPMARRRRGAARRATVRGAVARAWFLHSADRPRVEHPPGGAISGRDSTTVIDYHVLCITSHQIALPVNRRCGETSRFVPRVILRIASKGSSISTKLMISPPSFLRCRPDRCRLRVAT
jgi:hypothetical protein